MSEGIVEYLEGKAGDLLTRRRAACGCATWPKPCSTCDAYDDGLLDMISAVEDSATEPDLAREATP